MSDRPDNTHPTSEDSTPSDFEQRLEAFYLASDDAQDVRDLLLEGGEDDPELVLRMAALHEFAEEGLDLLAEDGAAVAARMPPGLQVGPYRLIREIGAGGMGVVFLAEDTDLGRFVALKILSRSGGSVDERFQREAEITASLDHPNIVPVYARGEAEGRSYLAMRFIAGDDIARTLGEAAKNQAHEAQDIYRDAAGYMALVVRALHAAHEAGVLHRDVKPSNILIENGVPFILDFGLATQEDNPHLTQPGDLLGTVPYMPPEQVRGEIDALDARSDIYAAGATLYHLLAGVVPFAGRSSQAIAQQILTRDPAPLRSLGVSRDLEAVVFKCLEKEPADRYPTALALALDLERYLSDEPVSAVHLGPIRRSLRTVKRNIVPVSGVLTVLFILVASIIALAVSRGEKDRAQEDVYRAALRAGEQEQYHEAVAMLEGLEAEDAAIAGLEESLLNMRALAHHDRLMAGLYVSSSPGFEIPNGELSGVAHARLGNESDVYRGQKMLDHFRFIDIVVLKRLGQQKRAADLLDAWAAYAEPSALRITLLRAYLSDRSEGVVNALPAFEIGRRQPEDHYFAGLLLALIPGGSERGLQEIDAWLDRQPANYWGRFIRGNLLRQLRRYGEARELYGGLASGLARSGADADNAKLQAALYQRGLLSSRMGEYEDALNDFKRAGVFLEGWIGERVQAHALFGLGRYEEARDLYGRALARFDSQPVPEKDREKVAALLRERGRTLIALSRYKEAEQAFATLGLMPGRAMESDELIAFLQLRKARDAGDAALRLAAAEIQEMVEEQPESRRLKLMLLELRARIGSDEERSAICRDLYAEEEIDPEYRYWRAWISFIFVEGRMRIFFDRERPIDLDQELDQQWVALEDEMVETASRAADDLSVVEMDGFHRLEGIYRDGVMAEFLQAAHQLWGGRPRHAAALFTRLARRPGVEQRAWVPLLDALHGQALQQLGRDREALAVFERGISRARPDDLCLSLAPRLAAKNEWWDALRRVLAAVEKNQPVPGWLERELRHRVYLKAREAGELP